MDDLISRQETIDIINTYAVPIHGYIGTPNDSEVYAYARGLLLSIERNMRALPSAQRKKGKWIKMSDNDGIYWACSECGEDIPRIAKFNPQFDLFPRMETIDKTNYCPNCGAYMREEDE